MTSANSDFGIDKQSEKMKKKKKKTKYIIAGFITYIGDEVNPLSVYLFILR